MIKTEPFDCVEMKRQGAEIVQHEISKLTHEQELAYWNKGTQELLRKQQELQKKKKTIQITPNNSVSLG